MTKVIVHPVDQGGCGFYRMSEPARANGIEPVLDDYQVIMERSKLGNRVVDIVNPPDCDVIVMQRPLRRQTCELIRVLQDRYGIAVVVEIDDNYHALPLQHPERLNTDPTRPECRDYNWTWLKKATDMADLVIASTPLLARIYGDHGRVIVLPNYVPRRYLDVTRDEHEGVWLGWTGSTHTHIRDLMVTKGAVGRALASSGAELHVVGSGEDVARQLESPEPIPSGWVDIENYPKAYAQFDVAFCPLKATAFNDGKSWLKPLEAAAVGVPVIMSPSAEYLRINEAGIGQIASSPTDWFNSLQALCTDSKLREEMAEKGREVVRNDFVLEDHAWKWMQAWETAASIRAERQ